MLPLRNFGLRWKVPPKGNCPYYSAFLRRSTRLSASPPLLGLLGTILGLVRALSALELGSGGSDRALDVIAGIGEALITTAVGLVIAIVTLIFANYFQGQYRRQRAFIQEAGGQLELLYRRQYRQRMGPSRDRLSGHYPYP